MSERRPPTHRGLIESRFRPQLGARDRLVRARLPAPAGLLCGALKAVSVLAPAGYGKTTLMAQWLEETARLGIETAWLNLDANDNDPQRLLQYLVGAIAASVPTLETDAVRAFVKTADSTLVLEDLTLRLAGRDRAVILFLDDAHVLENPDAIAIVSWLIAHSGGHLQFVVGSRQLLGWPQAELRLRGQLLEIGQSDLAFDPEEARQFWRSRLADGPDPTDFATLLSRTEGWPAAMELLALSLDAADDPGSFVAEFAASREGVLEYLSDSVFGRLPSEQRALAHELGQFDRFCVDLLVAATGARATMAAFSALQRRHVLMIPLDRNGRWFRFHNLASDYLRRHDPRPAVEIARNLTEGGRWLFEQGMADDAIDCAVRARDWDLACRWLLDSARNSAHRLGDGASLLRWVPAIPREALDRHPLVRLSHVFSLVFDRRSPDFERELTGLESLLERLAADPAVERTSLAELECALPVQRLMWDALRDDATRLRERAEAWLAAWPHASAHHRGDVHNVAAFAYKSSGDLDAAFDHCETAERVHEGDDGPFGVSWARVLRSILLLKRGDYRGALGNADDALRYVAERLHGHPEHAAYQQAVRAAVLYEFDSVRDAEAALEAHPDALDDRGTADFMLLTSLTRARLQFRAGRMDSGFDALQLGRRLGQRHGYPRVCVTLAGEECVWLCRLGRNAEALQLGRTYDLDRALHPQYCAAADKAARVAPRLLLADQPELAVAQIGPPLVRATEKGFHHRRVELLILQAAALQRCGRTGEALQSWRIALELAERFGYRRVFLDDIDIVASLGHAARGHAGIASPAWLHPQAARGTTRDEQPLTRKELRILRILETGASNREIADALFVSEGTLKWHLHNVYRKLGCRSRSGAVAAARRQGLI